MFLANEICKKNADISSDHFYIKYILANVAQFHDISVFLDVGFTA